MAVANMPSNAIAMDVGLIKRRLGGGENRPSCIDRKDVAAGELSRPSSSLSEWSFSGVVLVFERSGVCSSLSRDRWDGLRRLDVAVVPSRGELEPSAISVVSSEYANR
jgi:hypothetical protein